MNYNKLSKKAHSAAVSAGWYDKPKSTNELLTLTLSEFFEAMEAWRKQKYAKLNHTQIEVMRMNAKERIEVFKDIFYYSVKDTFEDEVADSVIRVCDMAGYLNIEIGDVKPWGLDGDGLELTTEFTRLVAEMYEPEFIDSDDVTDLLGFLSGVAKAFDFDLETHIELKMAYNATRGIRHGNKIA